MKRLIVTVHYLSIHFLSFVLNSVPRIIGIAFYGIKISNFSRAACPQTLLEEGLKAP